MTAKFDKFKKALQELCIEHGVVIGSILYDSPAVWDRKDGEDPIYCDDLHDATSEEYQSVVKT